MIAAKNGVPLDPAVVERLDLALASISFRLRVGAGAVMRYEPFADDLNGLEGAPAKLLAIVERHRAAGWRRLKRCDGEDCGRVYHDFSRSICSKWCSTRCGNKLSARGYRRRYKHRHGATLGARSDSF